MKGYGTICRACQSNPCECNRSRFKEWLQKVKRNKNWLPLLHVCIYLPFICVRTELMEESFECRQRRYIRLFIKVGKWKTDFELYNTWERIEDFKRGNN